MRGDRRAYQRITDAQRVRVLELRALDLTQQVIAIRMSLSRGAVRRIVAHAKGNADAQTPAD